MYVFKFERGGHRKCQLCEVMKVYMGLVGGGGVLLIGLRLST